MADAPYKERQVYQFSEWVYFTADGQEVERERVYDDHLVDIRETEPMTEQEIADFIGDDEEVDDDEP